MNSASGSSLNADALNRAREVSRSVASARSRSELSERLLPRLQTWLGADLAFLVLLDRRSRRPTIFGGTRDLHLRLGRVLRAQPRGLRPPKIDLEAANLSPETTLTVPLAHGLVQEGALVLTRRTPFEEFEKEALELLVENIVPQLQILALHLQLDRAHSDLREAQDSLNRHERMRTLGQLAVDVAHDVNNALSPVTAFSSILLAEDGLPERTRRYLELIHTSGKDAVQMLSRMTEFDAEGVASFLQPVEIAPLIGQVVEMMRPRIEKGSEVAGRSIHLQVETEPNLPLVFGDPVSLRTMLMNLIVNAIDALPVGGRIVVSARMESATPAGAPHSLKHVHIEVADNGEGMADETLRRCMDPFFTTKGAQGSGLGLSQVNRIVLDHAGRLSLSSVVGEGTRFTISLPAVLREKLALSEPGGQQSFRTARILCIDDDAGQLHLLGHLLEHDGHEVAVAVGGRAGVEAFVGARRDGNPFEVVITDLGMPDIDGRGVAAAIHNTDARTPVIVLTGWDSEAGSELLADVAMRVLTKPVQPTLLRQAIADALD